jgi:hypothetical protein
LGVGASVGFQVSVVKELELFVGSAVFMTDHSRLHVIVGLGLSLRVLNGV